jgi:hypothetical protein
MDVSPTVIQRCIRQFGSDSTKSFIAFRDDAFLDRAAALKCEMAMSLDVVFHLVEDDVFDRYMSRLFGSASRYVVVYATNEEIPDAAPHVRHRNFTGWVAHHHPDWFLVEHVVRAGKEAVSEPDFFVFEPVTARKSA